MGVPHKFSLHGSVPHKKITELQGCAMSHGPNDCGESVEDELVDLLSCHRSVSQLIYFDHWKRAAVDQVPQNVLFQEIPKGTSLYTNLFDFMVKLFFIENLGNGRAFRMEKCYSS